MFIGRFVDSVLGFVVGGLLGVIVWSMVVLAPTAIGRWF